VKKIPRGARQCCRAIVVAEIKKHNAAIAAYRFTVSRGGHICHEYDHQSALVHEESARQLPLPGLERSFHNPFNSTAT